MPYFQTETCLLVNAMVIINQLMIKQKKWERVSKQVLTFIDATGKPIDNGIREIVVALNTLGFTTTQSCEGHLNHGIAAPWVDISVKDIKKIEHLVHQSQLLFQRALQHKGTTTPIVANMLKQSHSLKTQAQKPLLKIAAKLNSLIQEYYATTTLPYQNDSRLTLLDITTAIRLTTQGALFQQAYALKQQKKQLILYQHEINAFTLFLKNKFFSTNNTRNP